MAALSDLLPVAAVRLDVRAADWREAIRAAGGLLTETGATTDAYTAEMIRNVEENGPYIVCRRGAVVGAFLNGVLITFLPALLLKVLGAFGKENTTFGDADFGWFGTLLGNAAKAGATGGTIAMPAIGAVLLGAAILFQKRVVDTGWDPGARRDALLPREAPAPAGQATAVVRTHAKIAPPPGAPTPPPPPAGS
ncbi:hypothetical protein DDE74_29990 [Streptomyces lydicus]|uniref:Ascorbate-specific PTS system EIIC component n=1 Tax=Streptomyces lydicus TaxID=47763 RepID=A0A3Q9KDW5_9ACTN|nr:PTS transporter subunit IIC [Streptomyces lydicus]AZS74612.1 hypothetical protein DDE74_29990 [Streptomyces lydicus]